MNGIKPALYLVASLGSSQVQADAPPQIKLELTQLGSALCIGTTNDMSRLRPGDCITYRITVENTGGQTARNVEVTALIPEHTELYRSIYNVHSREPIGSVVEHKADGTSVLKAAIDTVPAGQAGNMILEYSVKVI